MEKRLPTHEISTHTLRKEGDPPDVYFLYIYNDFNPHPPQGG